MNTTDGQIMPNLNNLATLYFKIKIGIILEENFDSKDAIKIAAMNELRNAFDHVMRALKTPGNQVKEMGDARDHVLRAGYDTYEALAMSSARLIIDSLTPFDHEIISAICPDYYKAIRPQIISLKTELAELRASRENSEREILEEETLNKYIEKAVTLLNFSKTIQEYIPDFVQAQKKKRFRIWINYSLTFISGVVITLLGILLKWYISDPSTPK